MKPLSKGRIAAMHATPKYKAHLAKELQRAELQVTGMKFIVAGILFGVGYTGYWLGKESEKEKWKNEEEEKEWK